MGLFDLLANTVEGVAQTAIGTAKLAAAPVTYVLTAGNDEVITDAVDTVPDGVEKIGKSEGDGGTGC